MLCTSSRGSYIAIYLYRYNIWYIPIVAQAGAAAASITTGARDGHALPKFEYFAAAADRNGSHDLCKRTVCARAFTVDFGTMNPPTTTPLQQKQLASSFD